MIKKLLAVLWLSLIPLSFTWATFTAHSIWAYTPSVWDSAFNVSVLALWDVNTENWSIDNFVFAPTNDLLFYRNVDSKPILLLPNYYDYRYWWELVYYYLCDEIPDSNFNWMTNCSSFQSINDEYLAYFMGTITSNDNWAYNYDVWLNVMYGFDLCFSSSSENKSLCFWVNSSVYNWWSYLWQRDFTQLYWYAQNVVPFSWWAYTDLTYTFDNIPLEEVWFSPYSDRSNNVPIPSSTWLDSYTYIEIWSWDYIDYFEQKEYFSEDICYIWTKDLNSNYEDRISYYQWTWFTIFDAYSNLYNTNNLSINKVWMFLNMIYANYRSWFLWYNRDSNWNVIYNMIYSWWSIELDYSTWLVNPFLNNKAYLYFIWSTALQTPNIDVYVAWQDVALYCYYKLGNYSNDWVNLTVKDDYDHNWLDQRVAVNSKTNRTQKTFYTWANEIVWKSREWTPLEYFQQWSWFIDPSDFFNENFNKFKEVLTPLSPWDLWLWYLPWYIIMFMCALILFRFLWH